MSSTSLNRVLVSFCRLYLRQRPGSLGARVGILQLHQQIALAYALSLANVDLPDGRWGRCVRVEILNRLDLAVSGNCCNQVLLSYMVDPDGNFALAAGDKSRQHDYRENGDNDASPDVLAVTVALSRVLCHQENKLKVYRTSSAGLSHQLDIELSSAPGIANQMPLRLISAHRHLNKSRFHLSQLTAYVYIRLAMQIGLRRAKEVTLAVHHEVQRTRVPNVAAGLSYYFLLSLFPLLIALATLLGYLPIPNLFGQSMDFAARFVPSEAMGLVRRILQSVLTPNRGGLLSIGLIGTLWAASGGFSAMIDALDIAYDARARRPMLKQRLLAVALTFMTGGLMAIAMLLTMVGDRAGHFLSNVLHLSYAFERSWPFVRWGIIGLCIVLSMELLYFFGPNIKQRFRHTLPGALIGTVLSGF
jgi:membrane protein